MKKIFTLLNSLKAWGLAWVLLSLPNLVMGQTTILSENMGTPTATTAITANTFQNSATLTYSNGAQTNPADVRATNVSSTYTGFSAGGNVFFTSTNAAYGFSIEGINASSYTSLSLQFGYRKESTSVHAAFSVDYWNGSAWQTIANTSSALFNEAANASVGWYLSKSLSLPSGAQISGLKIRFVKTSTASIRIDDVILQGTSSSSTPTKLAITSITPTSPTAGSGFDVTVQAQDGSNNPSNVAATTGFSLTTNGNAGVIGGITTGSITAGSNSVTVTGVILPSTGTSVTLTATRTSGDMLTAGMSSTFNVLAAASQIAFGTSPPASGNVGVNLASFTVEARRPDNSVDNSYTGNITITKASGSGTLSGTTTIAAVAGVATFSTLQLSAADTYTLTASASGFNITSSDIVVSVANATAILWSSAAGSAWLSTSNWTGNSVPTSSQVAQIGANPTGANVNINGGTTTVGAIDLTSLRATSLTIGNNSTSASNGTLTLNGVVVNSTSNIILNNSSDVLLTVQNTGSTGSSSNTMGIALGNTTDNIINIDGTGGITISSIISGSSKKLTKSGSGSGILTLTGANTYDGLTSISGGTLKLNRTGGTTIPTTNDVNVTGGTLQISSNQTLNDLTVSGGSVTIDNGITLTVNGSLDLSAGILTVGGGTLVINGATVTRTSGSIDASNASATVIFTNTSALSLPASTFSGNVANLTMNGVGGVTLGSAMTVTGTATMTSGKLTLGSHDLTIGSSGSITSANSTSYIVTNGTGLLKRSSVASSSVNFPIGTTSEYLPITSFSNSGTPDDYGAKVSASAPSCVLAAYSLTATWDISEGTALGSNLALTFQYNNTTAFGGSYTHAQAKLFHCNGATPDRFGPAGATLNGSVYTISHSGFTTLSPFGVSNDAVLPTELTNLTAKSKNGQNLISWQTATEKNANHFDIQRANNPQANWQTIGTVKAAGNSQATKDYQFADDAPLSISYYRLRSVDFDGKESLSNIVSVLSDKGGKLKVYPTIAQDKVTISLDSNEPQTFNIYNLLGQNVQTGQLSGQKDLNINQLSTGTYLLKVNGETVRFVKN